MARPDWIASRFALREHARRSDRGGSGTPNAADDAAVVAGHPPRSGGSRYRASAGRLLREVSTWSMRPYSRASSADRILSRSMSVLTCSCVRFE